jgi:hypothetical protein
MQNYKTPVAQTLPGGQAAPVGTTRSQFVYIRVHSSLLSIPASQARHLYLIEGRLEDIRRFSGATVDWVIKVAHFICNPGGASQVFTHTTGTTFEWYASDRDTSWRQVVQGNPLLPGIYEFVSTHPISFSKICERHNRSVTTPGSESNSTTFTTSLSHRDNGCVVTKVTTPVIASHLIPKRLGSDGVQAIVTRFSGTQAAVGIHRFDPQIGILLCSTLDNLVDSFRLGFYHDAVS